MIFKQKIDKWMFSLKSWWDLCLVEPLLEIILTTDRASSHKIICQIKLRIFFTYRVGKLWQDFQMKNIDCKTTYRLINFQRISGIPNYQIFQGAAWLLTISKSNNLFNRKSISLIFLHWVLFILNLPKKLKVPKYCSINQYLKTIAFLTWLIERTNAIKINANSHKKIKHALSCKIWHPLLWG